MKKIINRNTVSAFLYYTGTLYLFGIIKKKFGYNKALVFTGHRIINHPENKIDIMSLLSGQGITDVELNKRLYSIKRFYFPGDPKDLGQSILKDGCFYVTFDDGYNDNIKHAKPVLDFHDIKSVIFVVSHILNNPTINPWWDKYGEEELVKNKSTSIAKKRYLIRCGEKKSRTQGLLIDGDDKDAQETTTCNYFDVGQLYVDDDTFYYANHTSTHANLVNLTDADLNKELSDCMELIKKSPRYLPLLAYPFGAYNKKVLDKVQSMSEFSLAFATGGGQSKSKYDIKRINLNTHPYHLFYAELVDVFTFINWARTKFRKLIKL